MDLSKLSDEDLYALKAGDLTKVSDAGLNSLRGQPQQEAQNKQSTLAQDFLQAVGNQFAGAVRGAGSIGSTILLPADMINQKLRGEDFWSMKDNEARRQQIDEGLQLMGADPNSVAYKTGKIGGEILGTAGAGGALAKGAEAIPFIAKNVPALASALRSGGLSLGGRGGNVLTNAATRIGAGAAVGGASAGMINPEDSVTGAAIGGAIPVVAKVAGGAGRAFKAGLYDPLVNKNKLISGSLMRAVGQDNADDVIRALRTKASTPGVNLSAGEASGNEALLAMEDALKSSNPGGALSGQAQSNRVTLANVLRGIAQDDAAMTAAKSARDAISDPIYAKAPAEFSSAKITPELAKRMAALQARPAMASAMNEAKVLAQNTGVAMDDTTALGGLHYAKRALDDQISAAVRNGRTEEVKALLATKNELLGVLDQVSPSYRAGAKAFSDMSRPINQMEVGRKLSETLLPATSGDIPTSLNAASLARALRNPDALAQNATGFSAAKMANIMEPEQLRAITGVNADVSRLAEARKLGMGYGSPTARRLAVGGYIGENFASRAPMLSKIFDVIGQVPGVNIATKGGSAVGGMIGKGINKDIAMKLDELLANDPVGVSEMLRKELANLPMAEREVVLRVIPKSVLTSVGVSAASQ